MSTITPHATANPNNTLCTTCDHPRAVHRLRQYYCEAEIMVIDKQHPHQQGPPDNPGKPDDPGPPDRIKTPCPCTAYTTIKIGKIDKDSPFGGDSPNKDSFTRDGIDIKDPGPQEKKPKERDRPMISEPDPSKFTGPSPNGVW